MTEYGKQIYTYLEASRDDHKMGSKSYMHARIGSGPGPGPSYHTSKVPGTAVTI